MRGVLFANVLSMRFSIITIFPRLISDYSKISIIARAAKKKFIKISAIDLRDFTSDPHKTVDSRPYGGGAGMVLRADILQKAISKTAGAKARENAGAKAGATAGAKRKKTRVILLTPQGKKFEQKDAQRLAEKYSHLVFICGRYEGFDERVRKMADEEISVGDYVLMGGELPALIIAEAVSRFVPGVIGKSQSLEFESFSTSKDSGGMLLEYPQYTRPEILRIGKHAAKVPQVLLSGNHKKINEWRRAQALSRTKRRRPDLLLP